MREIRITSERRTQLIDVTERVREAAAGTSGTAVLVYVPHTTAGITINEKIDPILVEDLERGFERIVGDDLGWRHDDKDGPNGASHGRASVAGAQVIVPLRDDGTLALGTYQAIFLCEFDGTEAALGLRRRPPIDTSPLLGLRLRTVRLELRLPNEHELIQFGELARAGIHPEEFMPFRIPWTDDSDSPGFVDQFVAHHLELRRKWRPEHWMLLLGVWAEGRPIGTQDLRAERFAATHVVESGSWLGERYQRRGYGTEMRIAVLALGFEGLGALAAISGPFDGNTASARVSEKLGYVESGEHFHEPRGVRVREQAYRLEREVWLAQERPPVEIDGLEPCLPLFGV